MTPEQKAQIEKRAQNEYTNAFSVLDEYRREAYIMGSTAQFKIDAAEISGLREEVRLLKIENKELTQKWDRCSEERGEDSICRDCADSNQCPYHHPLVERSNKEAKQLREELMEMREVLAYIKGQLFEKKWNGEEGVIEVAYAGFDADGILERINKRLFG